MLSDTVLQYFQGMRTAFLVVEESLEQSNVLVLPEPDCRAVSAVLDCYFLEVFEEGEAVIADPLIKRAQTVYDVLCHLDFDVQAPHRVYWDNDSHVLPAEACKSVHFFIGCLVDLTGLAVDLHFELDCIAGSGVAGIPLFLSWRVGAGLLKEQPHVRWAGCEVGRILLIFRVLLTLGGRFEEVLQVAARGRASALEEIEGAGGRCEGLEEGVDRITCLHITNRLIKQLSQ